MCFKKLECRVEIGVRVGGLPGEVRRVSGTSVVHYELIRGGSVQLCVCLCVCVENGAGQDEER